MRSPGIENALRWSDVDRCRLLLAITLPFFVAYALRSAYLMEHPSVEPYYDREALSWMRDGLILSVVLYASALLWGGWLRRRPGPHTTYLACSSLLWWLSVTGVAYALGPLTTPSWIAILIGGVAHLLLFPRGVALFGTASGLALTVGGLAAVALGWIPYAPALSEFPMLADRPAAAYLIGNTFAALFATLLILGVVKLVLNRWRRAVEELETSNVNLERIVTERTNELLQAERSLQQAQKMEAIGRLAGGIAHDFNNLLGVVVAHADLLLRSRDRKDPVGQDARAIREAATGAARLVDQLLAVGRQQIMRPTPLQLNELVLESAELLRSLLGEEVELGLRLESDLEAVEVDRDQMKQVLLRLASNARDAIAGPGRVTITTGHLDLETEKTIGSSTVPPGRYVVLSVRDTGRGMDSELQMRAFEPFFNTRGSGPRGGLELSSVYGIVVQSGGCVGLDSRAGEGSVFSIYLPRIPRERIGAPAPARLPSQAVSPATILLAEDDAALRRVLRRALTAEGHVVLEAADGAAALALARQREGDIDLLVTDVIMPALSGRELAEALRAEQPELRILFITGHTDDRLLRRGISDRSVEILRKPFSLEQLEGAVRAALAAGERIDDPV